MVEQYINDEPEDLYAVEGTPRTRRWWVWLREQGSVFALVVILCALAVGDGVFIVGHEVLATPRCIPRRDAPHLPGPYSATGRVDFPTLNCRLRSLPEFSVDRDPATGGLEILGLSDMGAIGFDLYGIEPHPDGVYISAPISRGGSSTYGFSLTRWPMLLDLAPGTSEAVSGLSGDYVLTVRRPTATRWEMSIVASGLPRQRGASPLIHGLLTLETDNPTPPWRHIDVTWTAQQTDGDVSVVLHLNRNLNLYDGDPESTAPRN